MEKPVRIPELDGLRGLAILLVIFYHDTNGELLTRLSGFAYYIQRSAMAGWTGANLFFVLSGFLIGGILIDTHGSNAHSFSCQFAPPVRFIACTSANLYPAWSRDFTFFGNCDYILALYR